MDAATVIENVREVSAGFAQDRGDRQRRKELDPADFAQLADAGFQLTGVLPEHGGLWESVPATTRLICELLRILAHGDSSVALVSAMHPGVLSLWLGTPDVPSPYNVVWQAQRTFCSETALSGAWWGTITSEPGSGGDIFKTKTIARRDSSNGGYRISGLKHFGSGSGITSYMITIAVPEGEIEPDWFFLDVADAPWDGSTGLELMFPWDGHGMIATQSHGMRFDSFPATRVAWPGNILNIGQTLPGLAACCFTAVIVGIVEIAIETARQRLQGRHASLRAYEQVEWSRVEVEGWLIQQAYEGMLRAVEAGGPAANREALLGKTAVAELAESVTARICKVIGGGSYARHSPFGFWFEDVRALGFLRPPWVLAYDQLFDGSWKADDAQ